VVVQTLVKTVSYVRKRDLGTISLTGCVDIFEAQAVLAAARRAFADSKAESVFADLSGVEKLDLTTVQILFALRRDLQIAGRKWTISASEIATAPLQQAGFTS
jgi:anti-anti-sigma regulatory factor